MAVRRPYRPRKIVDYSQFASQDSDDDDFSDSRQCKKTKSLSSKDVIKNPSDIAAREIATRDEYKNANKELDVSKMYTFVQFSNEKKKTENEKMQTAKKAASTKEHLNSGSKDNGILDDCKSVQCDDDKNVTAVEKHSDEDDHSDYSGTGDSENDSIDSSNSNKCNNRQLHSGYFLQAESETSSAKSLQSVVTGKSSVRSKWKAPGPASASSLKKSDVFICDGVSKSNTSLRIGLSRKTRIKPLHANIKIRP